MDSSKELRDRRRWEPPELKPVGTVGGVLKGGQGKIGISQQDSGDTLKPKGQG